jgi:hypothetical protein
MGVLPFFGHDTVYFLAHICPVAFFCQMIALKKNPLLVLFLMAQKCQQDAKVGQS